jgi:hypothetical protein
MNAKDTVKFELLYMKSRNSNCDQINKGLMRLKVAIECGLRHRKYTQKFEDATIAEG